MNFHKFILVMGSFILAAMLFQEAKAQKPPEGAFISNFVYGIRLGLLAHDVGGLWSHSQAESGYDINVEIVFKKPSVIIGPGIIQPNLGMSINSQGDTSKIYGGLLWEFLFNNGYFVNSGVGLAIHDGQLESKDSSKKQLGSRVLFRIPFEFGFTISECHRISLMFDHMSNAYLANPNEGLDTIGVRYGLQF